MNINTYRNRIERLLLSFLKDGLSDYPYYIKKVKDWLACEYVLDRITFVEYDYLSKVVLYVVYKNILEDLEEN